MNFAMRTEITERLSRCRCGDKRLKQNKVEKSTPLPGKKVRRGRGMKWTVKKGKTKREWFDAFQVS
jgi:hypothetical protein